MKNVLTIAGSDPSAGAGIQADLVTFSALGVRGMTAITAMTAQNEKRFFSVNPVSSILLREQIQAITSVHSLDAVKIGMIGTEDNALTVSRFLEQLQREGKRIPVVLDPIFKSSTGTILLDPKGIGILTQKILPLVTLVTPNLSEAEILSKIKIESTTQMGEAAAQIFSLYKGVGSVLVKGGHLLKEATDVLFDGRETTLFPAKQRFSQNVHGTGCVLSAAIAASLAKGEGLVQSVRTAKEVVTAYIQKSLA